MSCLQLFLILFLPNLCFDIRLDAADMELHRVLPDLIDSDIFYLQTHRYVDHSPNHSTRCTQ